MNRGQIIIKLTALRNAINQHMKGEHQGRDPRYFNPENSLEYFQRFIPLRDRLKKLEPHLFGDLPVRDLPQTSGTSDFGGNGYFTRNQIKSLVTDIDYCLDVISPANTQDRKLGAKSTMPAKITLAWLKNEVPVQFWLWLFGVLIAVFLIGVRVGQIKEVSAIINAFWPGTSKDGIGDVVE